MRLIDAEKVIGFLNTGKTKNEGELYIPNSAMKNIIELSPTVDAVEVTRCKDCKYNMYGNCYLLRWYVNETDFCAWGEKK